MRSLFLLLCFYRVFCVLFGAGYPGIGQGEQAAYLCVAVFNSVKTKTAITDFDGYVDISAFSENELINFVHPSHLDRGMTKVQIRAANNMVFMGNKASTLGEIVLSVAKFGQRKKDIPQQIVSVTSEDILFRNPQTAADLLQNSDRFMFRRAS